MDNRIITHETLGITAPATVWTAIWGANVYSNSDVITRGMLPSEYHELLVLGMGSTGSNDERAVIWAIAEHQRRQEAKTEATATARLADAIMHMSAALGEETAAGLVARMPDRLRPYAEAVLRNR